MTYSMSTPARAALAALALAAVSTGASAFTSVLPDPFWNHSVDLQSTPPGSRIELPGVGPGGTTLYASSFLINGFSTPSTVGDVNTYSATFNVNFLNQDGSVALNPGNGQPGVAHLPGTFVVQFVGRASNFDIGTYTANLQTATFSGMSSINTPLYVNLANIPQARINIAGTPGNYEITYLTPFNVQGQYFNNLNGSGNPVPVPPLGDTNGQPAQTPVPATAALAIPGLLAMAGLRRRRAAVAA